MARIYRFVGDQWTGKTTCALSGEGGTWYGELDSGSWDRAINGIDTGLVEHFESHPPTTDLLQTLLDDGVISTEATGRSGSGPIRVIHQLEGYHENLLAFRQAFVKAILNPDIQNLVFDTESDLWKLLQKSLEQRIQQETNVKRERLSSLEYEDLHGQMDQFVQVCRVHKKNLILITRTTDEWVKNPEGSGQMKSGRRIADGWDRAPYRVDVELMFTVKNKIPQATIAKAGGASLALGGVTLTEPTLPKIELLIECARAIRADKRDLPEEVEDILDLGRLMGVEG